MTKSEMFETAAAKMADVTNELPIDETETGTGRAAKSSAKSKEAKMASSRKKKTATDAKPDLKVVGGTSETEVDPAAAASKIAPETVGNPNAAASLSIDQEHLEELASPGEKSSVVECRRPAKGQFFTVRSEPDKKHFKDRAFYFILEVEGRDPYIVSPAIAKQKMDTEDCIRPVMLCRFVTMAGVEGLWPVKLNPADGKSNPWNTSALNILEIAEKSWVRIVSLKANYRHQSSNKTLAELPPRFTDRPFDELVNTAFKDDRVVTTLDHEIWDILANGRTK